MEAGIVELEKRLTYLEKYVDELNEVVISQGKIIDRLKAEVKVLRDKDGESEVDASRPADEKPPHY
ncbi:MAG: SlyX family protein [Candidatus Rifleibacteriota bacterium]